MEMLQIETQVVAAGIQELSQAVRRSYIQPNLSINLQRI